MDETELPPAVRNRLAELRACDNIASVEVLEITPQGVRVLIVPTGSYAAGGGWEMPTEPRLVLIPMRRYAN